MIGWGPLAWIFLENQVRHCTAGRTFLLVAFAYAFFPAAAALPSRLHPTITLRRLRRWLANPLQRWQAFWANGLTKGPIPLGVGFDDWPPAQCSCAQAAARIRWGWIQRSLPPLVAISSP